METSHFCRKVHHSFSTSFSASLFVTSPSAPISQRVDHSVLTDNQLRSSRSNRHLQQDTPQGRTRGGVVDHDPTEGLPVRRWEMIEVTVNQEPKEEGKDEDSRNGINENWPWPDHLLPRDIHLLPAHSQVHFSHLLIRFN